MGAGTGCDTIQQAISLGENEPGTREPRFSPAPFDRLRTGFVKLRMYGSMVLSFFCPSFFAAQGKK